jgi:hypothetical protein
MKVDKISKQISEQFLEALLYGQSSCYVDWEKCAVYNKPAQDTVEIICEETGEGFELVKTVEHEGKFRLVIKRESSNETV